MKLITDKVNAYARIGTMTWQAKAKIKNNEFTKHRGVSPVIIAGVEVSVNNSLPTRLDYQWTENFGKER